MKKLKLALAVGAVVWVAYRYRQDKRAAAATANVSAVQAGRM